MLADGFELAPRFVDYVRAHGPKVADVMPRDVITVTPEIQRRQSQDSSSGTG
jgi:hypothetical protein